MFVTRIAFIFPLSHIKGFFYSAKIKYPHLNFMKTPKRFHEKDTTDRLAQASIWRNTQLPCVFRWEGSQGLFLRCCFSFVKYLSIFNHIFVFVIANIRHSSTRTALTASWQHTAKPENSTQNTNFIENMQKMEEKMKKKKVVKKFIKLPYI